MKRITIYQENSNPVTITDADDTDRVSYSKDLANLLSHHAITILVTTHSVAIVRPSKITSIVVDEEQNTKQSTDIPTEKEDKKIEPQEDIITDA